MEGFNSNLETKKPQHHTSLLLKTEVIVFISVFTLVCRLFISVIFSGKNTEASDLTYENILNAVNREREIRNIGKLTTNSMLTSAAQWKADDMIARNYFAHVDPDGKYIWPKIVEAGYYPYLQLGENLAIEFYNTESLISAWMNSPTHRANLLNEGFKDQGMGLAFGTNNQYHSSIANTFGTIQYIKEKTPPPAPSEITPKADPEPAKPKTVVKKTTPKVVNPTPPVAQIEPKPTPTPNPSPENLAPQTTPKQIKPREKSWVLTENSQNALNTSSSEPVFNLAKNQEQKTETNRYVILILGILVLLILSQDIKLFVKSQPSILPDKKVGNLAVLILTLVIVAMIYWM